MTNELQIKTKSEIRISEESIDKVAKRISDKLDIPIEKAETELKMGVVMAMMINRHKVQEMKEEK
jgi:hypothetical protein